MAITSTKAIVVSSLRYSDSSLIVKLYTKQFGLVSYLVRGILKSKKGKLKAAYFQPLTLLNIITNYQEKKGLQTIREAQVTNVYSTLHSDIVKQSLVMFLSEVISSSIQEEESNDLLYDYLENSFLWLDSHDNISNFHLLFLLNLSKFLGFYPDSTNDRLQGFHLVEGVYTDQLHEKDVIKGKDFFQFKKLLGINFDTLETINFSKSERGDLLRMLIRYFELHLGGFRTPKSLEVLETVFSR